MKTLAYGIVLILVIGIAGFLYRASLERTASAPAMGTACTLEAKICPDGTSVGRTGPSCAFAPCPPGNISVPQSGIAFALPDGYAADEHAADADPTMVGAFVKTATSSAVASPGMIIVHDYAVPSGSSPVSVILAHAILDPSGLPATANQLTPKVVGSHTFQSLLIGRFEGTVESEYFLQRSSDVLAFKIVETGVSNWADPSLNVDSLPEHQALLKLLTTLQASDPALQPAAVSTTTTP